MGAARSIDLSIAEKYGGRIPTLNLDDRLWPSKRLSKCPIWFSTDLRDGNQALPNPMTKAQKRRMFETLVGMGFKEIEVSFPVASDIEFDFTRELVDDGAIPEDVRIGVLTPCRPTALKRAVDALRGAKMAHLYTYLPTSDNYRETVLGLEEGQWLKQASEGIRYAKSITKDDPVASAETDWQFAFGFEDFGNTRPEVALKLAQLVMDIWEPTSDKPVVFGLAASVEIATPNVYADQVEIFCRNLPRRELAIVSIHTHNDRGGAVASAELALLAGGDRVEGCLFGNGERAGNLDLVTAGMNMLSFGIDPGLDFTRLSEVRTTYEAITGLSVHPRTPYSGDLYFRAFSGAHQDAIWKGLQKRGSTTWRIPYLPVDPAEVGKDFDCVIGINSQSGKGGTSWLIRQSLGLNMPRELAADFASIMKQRSIQLQRGLTNDELCTLFVERYAFPSSQGLRSDRAIGTKFTLCDPEKVSTDKLTQITTRLDATLGFRAACRSAYIHTRGVHGIAEAEGHQDFVAFVECAEHNKANGFRWGVSISQGADKSISEAILAAVQS